MAGANLRQANLTNADFVVSYSCSFCRPSPAALTDADLTAADARGSNLFALLRVRGNPSFLLVGEGAIATNTIRADGHVNGLDLLAGDLLLVRDYDGDSTRGVGPIPITIDQHLTMGPGGTLRMAFEADAWDSTISFAPGIPVTLGGTLELTFATDVNLASQVGRTFDLFDWSGVDPTSVFAISSPYRWDLSNLYTTGEVTLTAVPEPDNIVLAAAGAVGLIIQCRRKNR